MLENLTALAARAAPRGSVGNWLGRKVIWSWIFTLTTIDSNRNPSTDWQSVTFTTIVDDTRVTHGVPTGTVQLVTTLLKLLPLIAVMALAAILLAKTGPSVLMPFQASAISPSAITAAATLTLWALLGMESATVPAGKVVDPERTIPRATMVGTAFAGIIYLIVCSAVVLLTPADLLKSSNAPFADFVGLHGGGDARLVLAGFAAISGFGALNGWMLLQGEIPYAMAKGGVFPAFLAKTSKRGAPVRAHLISSVFLTILVTMNYAKSMVELFTFMALLATAISLFAYLFCALAAVRLQMVGRMPPSRLLVVVAVVATVYSFWTLYGAGAASLWSLLLLVLGLPIHWLIKRVAVVPASTTRRTP